MQAHWSETTVGEHGQLVLEGLPFEAGQSVEVFVMAKDTGAKSPTQTNLWNSVLEYHEPLEPVAQDDWGIQP